MNKHVCILILLVLATACTPVKPWQKGNLARRDMAITTDPFESNLRDHIFDSKEAARGGRSVGGGGCGCN